MINLSQFNIPSIVQMPYQGFIGKLAYGTNPQLTLLESHKVLLQCKNFFDPTSALPVGPANNDRYVSEATANGWTVGRIYTWNGSSWLETTPADGYFVNVVEHGGVGLGGLFIYHDSKWQLKSFAYYNLGTSSAGTYYFNAMRYSHYKITIGASTTTIAPTGTYTSGVPYRVVFHVYNGAAFTLAWNSAIKWANGAPPSFTASGNDMVVLTTIDGGTIWQGSTAGTDYK